MMAKLSFQYICAGADRLVCGQSCWEWPCATVHTVNCFARISGLGNHNHRTCSRGNNWDT